MRGPAAHEAQRTVHDNRGLAAAGLVHGRVVRLGRGGARLEAVQRHFRAQAGQRRGEHLVVVTRTAAAAALVRPDDGHAVRLVQAQQLRQSELQAAGNPLGDR